MHTAPEVSQDRGAMPPSTTGPMSGLCTVIGILQIPKRGDFCCLVMRAIAVDAKRQNLESRYRQNVRARSMIAKKLHRMGYDKKRIKCLVPAPAHCEHLTASLRTPTSRRGELTKIRTYPTALRNRRRRLSLVGNVSDQESAASAKQPKIIGGRTTRA
uniref:Uncharacterized protein n=1 Tax=Lotharella globosa TaxID=91324 RepID=A0A7S3Z861_9EUKA|mmetsp:Transcript_490/g.883  ORF Transcript_490/g.883 Transcript_490/m.883 type:complete len:158 (+) Transcript_490:70-543(+)